jgi:hypothetical protein
MKNKEFAVSFLKQFFVDGETATQVRPDVEMALKNYFSTSGKGFTGSQFEILIENSDPDAITARDLVAITSLSVNIPARAALWILSKEAQSEISNDLREIPVDIDIWDPAVKDIFSDSGPVMSLWRKLGEANWPEPKQGGGLGGTTKRSKILVAKRPRLIPVLDRVVKGTLPVSDNTWISIQKVLMNQEHRTKIQDALNFEFVPRSVSLLRRIDIVIWMNNKKEFQKKK